MGYTLLFGCHWCWIRWGDGLDDQGSCWAIILERLQSYYYLDIDSTYESDSTNSDYCMMTTLGTHSGMC